VGTLFINVPKLRIYRWDIRADFWNKSTMMHHLCAAIPKDPVPCNSVMYVHDIFMLIISRMFLFDP
jgi:hypothetical protein